MCVWRVWVQWVEGEKIYKDVFNEEMGKDMLVELIQINILVTDLLCKDISFREFRSRSVNSSN